MVLCCAGVSAQDGGIKGDYNQIKNICSGTPKRSQEKTLAAVNFFF
jgi:hypothetical protein